MYDPTAEKLAGLAPSMQQRAYWMIVAARQAGVPLMIISGRRTTQENALVGGAENSFHLAGRAIDVQVAGYTREQIPTWWWQALGQWAESNLGLRWGGRFGDLNHFDEGFS